MSNRRALCIGVNVYNMLCAFLPSLALSIMLTFGGVSTSRGEMAPPLSAYNVDPSNVGVSGLSSGGYMASQLGIAYSGTFTKGFGVFAGGPFDCARDQAYSTCMFNQTPTITAPVAHIQSWNRSQIDNISNLQSRRVFLWEGSADSIVGVNVTNQFKSEIQNFVPSDNFSSVITPNAVHTFPTDFDASGNNRCSVFGSPYVSNCQFDGAGAALQWIHRPLNPRNDGTPSGQVVAFDQAAFGGGTGMDSTGYLYVPANCKPGGATVCKLHVALHGCDQNYNKVQMTFIQNTGYNKWADTNNMIIVYPQSLADPATMSTVHGELNPQSLGCWDWVGWYGNNYDQKGGRQVAAIVAMVDKITSGYHPDGGTPFPAPGQPQVTETTGNSISLTWPSQAGAVSYNVYRNGVRANSSALTATSYKDTGLASETQYTYTVTSVNSGAQESKASLPVSASTTTGIVTSCYTATNYAHLQANRASWNLLTGHVYALGSSQDMGLYNIFTSHTLEETSPNYYVIKDSGCP